MTLGIYYLSLHCVPLSMPHPPSCPLAPSSSSVGGHPSTQSSVDTNWSTYVCSNLILLDCALGSKGQTFVEGEVVCGWRITVLYLRWWFCVFYLYLPYHALSEVIFEVVGLDV